jgi:Arc/MetJ-type ribon-helix-helix transcriptional regulator
VNDKDKLSVTVDPEVAAAAKAAVTAGRVGSVSAWVNEALHRQLDHERRLEGLDRFVAAYEAEHGVITDDEMAEAVRSARADAIVVRGKRSHGAA